MENGKPRHVALAAEVSFSHNCFRYYAGWVDKITGTTVNADGPFFAYTTR
jgi:aldehyde dehydrogenase (NAD+)